MHGRQCFFCLVLLHMLHQNRLDFALGDMFKTLVYSWLPNNWFLQVIAAQSPFVCKHYTQEGSSGVGVFCPPHFFPAVSMVPFGLGCSLDRLGSAATALSPPCSSCAPSLLLVWNRKGLDCVSALLSNKENIPELSTLFPAEIQTTASYQLP